jgi:hypothetical protein
MPVELVSYVSDLNPNSPSSSEDVSEGDDHLRAIKGALKATFPSIAGPVTPSHVILNGLDGRIKRFEDAFLSSNQIKANSDLDLNSHKLINVASPSNPTDVATKSYVDNATGGVGATVQLPIGYVLLSTNSANPATYLHYGTWVKRADGLTLSGVGTGADSAANSKTVNLGGNSGLYKKTLALSEVPTGVMTGWTAVDRTSGVNPNYGINGPDGNYAQDFVNIFNTSGGHAFDIAPPTYGVYVFERTA